MFCFLSYPYLLFAYDAQYLKIIDLVDQLSKDEWGKLHIFSYFEGFAPKMDKIQLDSEDFKRIWFISSRWEEGVPLPINAQYVKDYMLKNFEKISSKEKNGIHVELYTKIKRSMDAPD